MMSIILKLKEQKQRLIAVHPSMEFQFVDIYHPKLRTSIPFLPIRCFRDFYVRAVSEGTHPNKKLLGELGTVEKTFVSSGSTNATCARHTFSQNALHIYAENSAQGFERFLMSHGLTNSTIISLVPPPSLWPTSSLSAMLQMFKKHGFALEWCDVDGVTACQNFLNIIGTLPENHNVIVFGTTFHHVNLIQKFFDEKKIEEKNRILERLRVSVIDTGGTKGKTQFLALDEIQTIFKEFYSFVNFLSEYGMCELGSQAWSFNSIHNGTFVANETLAPFAIDLKNFQVLPESKMGFLGFIDCVNVESYGAIITEDLGHICSETGNTFKLYGRASDASIKGCSLRVNTIPNLKQKLETATETATESETDIRYQISDIRHENQFSESETETDIRFPTPDVRFHHQLSETESARRFQMSDFISHLNKNYWNATALADFEHSFQSLNQLPLSAHQIFDDSTVSNVKNEDFKHKHILLISAANTPISFVYPLVHCALNSAKTFTLKIPSLRANDPMSENIRLQMIDLFQNLANLFPQTQFFMNTSRSMENNFSYYDAVFVFGTNETLNLIKTQCPSTTQFFGFGDIKNAVVVDETKHSPKFVADLCSVWNGRGCLTPVCVFVNPTLKHDYVESFFRNFVKNMHERFQFCESHFSCEFMHDHSALFVQNQLRTYGIAIRNSTLEDYRIGEENTSNYARVLRAKNVTVVDLSHVSTSILQKMSLDFSLGGSGFVYILPLEMKNRFHELSFRDVFPAFTQFTIQDSSEKS